MTVETVNGPIPQDALGTTLMHEHVFAVTRATLVREWPQLWDREAAVENAIGKLGGLRELGVSTLVDLTPMDLGRDVRAIERVASATGLNIVVCTGFWLRPPPEVDGLEVAAVAKLFVHDIEVGIQQTQIKAAIIKCATATAEASPTATKILQAAAAAHERTGVPISTHSDPQLGGGLDQQRILRESGVDLERVVIGHSGDTTDRDYLQRLLDNGSYLGLDRFGLDQHVLTGAVVISHEDRFQVLVDLCARGYADRLVLGQDASCHLDSVSDAELRRRLPNWHHEYLARDVLPTLREAGVTDAQIDTMMVHNPRRILAGTP